MNKKTLILALFALLLPFAQASETAPLPVDDPELLNPAVPMIEIAHGEEFELEDYIVPGKINIFNFFSEFCGPCNAIKPKVMALNEGNPDVNIIRVNVNRPGFQGIDWNSPVVKQYKLRSIPYFIIIELNGSVKKGAGAKVRFDSLYSALEE